MTTPTVAATNGGYDASAQTSRAVGLPAGISAGDLLLVFIGLGSTVNIYTPAGWTSLFNKVGPVGRLVLFYRVADGGEGASVTITSDNNVCTWSTFRITGYSGTPECGTAVASISASPNPPNLAPSWGALDTLWFAVVGILTTSGEHIDADPANYSFQRWGNSGAWGIETATRALNASSEDPGVFTASAATWYVANTIAIKPVVTGWAHISKVNAVAAASISKMNGVAVAAISKINGVAV